MIEQAEPAFAGRVRRLLDAGRHKTIATLRADGSPRISGIECEFSNGDLRFGSMAGARKGADLRRDPRADSSMKVRSRSRGAGPQGRHVWPLLVGAVSVSGALKRTLGP
ncbi:MAG TPA: pyridoxamine 5'-phosphate oxidase family protein, partial [Acidimicrobiales bacterium]|nr:pyridoxamine 5'-phosphate oxidase family protein [Acidimicrobiales bacterium]